MNFVDKYRIKKTLRKFGDYDSNDFLAMIGLERRSIAVDVFADLGFFTLGAFCGAAVGMIFAPRTGVELRRNLRHAVEGAAEGKANWSGMKETLKPSVDHRV